MNAEQRFVRACVMRSAMYVRSVPLAGICAHARSGYGEMDLPPEHVEAPPQSKASPAAASPTAFSADAL